MHSNDNVRITFYSEDKEDNGSGARELFAYVLLKANENNYFNPRYNNSELFDLFEDLMVAHCEYTDDTFDTTDTANNMERFYNATQYLDDGRKQIIDETFSDNANISNLLEKENLSTTISAEFNTDMNLGGIVLNIPISSQDYMESLMREDEGLLNNLPFSPFSNENSEEQFMNIANSDEYGGILDNHRVTAHNQQVVPEKVFNQIAETLKTQTQRLPEAFIPFNTRLHGIDESMMVSIQNKIIAIIDIIAFLNNYIYEPHWTDIFEFTYNFEGESLEDLTEYVSEQHLLLTTEPRAFTKYYDEVLFLQRHLVELSKKKGHNDAQPLTVESQLLLAFVDYMSQACSLEEGGLFE